MNANEAPHRLMQSLMGAISDSITNDVVDSFKGAFDCAKCNIQRPFEEKQI